MAQHGGTDEMHDLLIGLLTWITTQMAVGMPAVPTVEMVPSACVGTWACGRVELLDGDVLAAYDRSRRTVCLHGDWNQDSLRDRSALVHELVHYVQHEAGLGYPCDAARERQAYGMQIEWLRDNGVAEPYALLNLDPFTIAVRSMCPETE